MSNGALNVEQVLRLHNLTKDVSKLCERQLRVYLDAVGPLFRPRRILGDHIEGPGRESAAGAEQNFAELKELFQRVTRRPIDVHKQLGSPIESISTQLQIHPWEYVHDIQTGSERKRITVRTPLTWTVGYPSTYSLSMLRQVITGGHDRDQNHIAAFALRASVMSLMFEKLSGLKSLFEGLRYPIQVRKSPELGDLPLITVSAPFPSFRPADEIVLVASGVSGGNAFEEVLDLEALRQLSDPIKNQVQSLLELHGEKL